MTIDKIVVRNYMLLESVVIPLNPDVNIFIDDNDSGKSTILEALCILTTGIPNGYAFERQLKTNVHQYCKGGVYSKDSEWRKDFSIREYL